MPDAIGLITARGGSKGVPRKNVRSLAGKPVIAWTIEAARQARSLRRVIVSTDDEEIAAAAREHGAEVPFMRPAELAGDASSHISVVIHAIEWLEAQGDRPDYVMLIQPTSPLLSGEDIDAACRIADEHDATAVLSVSEMDWHPYIAKRIGADGTLQAFMEADLSYLRRQDMPPAYALNGAMYLNRRESLLRDQTFWPERSYPYVMPEERSLDIDTEWDFHLLDLVLRDQSRQ
jgi:CMP-N,N'-diacetyllegionaminic acid synthase